MNNLIYIFLMEAGLKYKLLWRSVEKVVVASWNRSPEWMEGHGVTRIQV